MVDTDRDIRGEGQGDSAPPAGQSGSCKTEAIQQQGPREAVLVVYAVSDRSTG